MGRGTEATGVPCSESLARNLLASCTVVQEPLGVDPIPNRHASRPGRPGLLLSGGEVGAKVWEARVITVAYQEQASARALLLAAQVVRLPFEASPTGRWIRFDAAGKAVYVVRDAFGDGCVVLSSASGAAIVSRFRDVQQAVSFAANLGRRSGEPLRFQRVELAAS